MNIKKLFNKFNKDLTKERDERCIPMAKQILLAIAEDEGKTYAEGNHEKQVKAYTPLVEKILTIMLENNVRSSEVDYITRLLREPIDISMEMVVTSLNKSIDRATDIVWNKSQMEITLKDIDKILVENQMK